MQRLDGMTAQDMDELMDGNPAFHEGRVVRGADVMNVRLPWTRILRFVEIKARLPFYAVDSLGYLQVADQSWRLKWREEVRHEDMMWMLYIREDRFMRQAVRGWRRQVDVNDWAIVDVATN